MTGVKEHCARVSTMRSSAGQGARCRERATKGNSNVGKEVQHKSPATCKPSEQNFRCRFRTSHTLMFEHYELGNRNKDDGP
jgi:hypothetical protein